MLPSQLDHGVAVRQALTVRQRAPKDAEAQFESLRQGALRMPPHPVWQTSDLLDWTADPFKDRNWQFQHHTLRWLDAPRYLAQQGDKRAQKFWLDAVRSWSRENLPPAEAVSPWAWKDMADGTRAVVLALGCTIVPDEQEWFVGTLEAHRDYLLDESNIVRKNHAMHQLVGLLVVSAVLRDRHSCIVARDRLARLFEGVFDSEGANNEGALGYHQFNLTWWAGVWQRVQAEGLAVPEDATARLEHAADALVHMTQPDGKLPQIGDTKRGVGLQRFGPGTEWVRTGGNVGEEPDVTARVFQRGYATSRSGWASDRGARHSHMVLRFGKDERSHSHHDRGAVHLYTNGRPWLVDSGFINYQRNDPFRRYTLGRSAHNTPFIADSQVDELAEVELLSSRITDDAHDFRVWDKAFPGVRLERRVTYLPGPDSWVVHDEARSESVITLGHRWVVDYGLQVRLHDRGYVLRDRRSEARMHWLGRSRPRMSLHRADEDHHEGWIATKWNHKEPGAMVTAAIESRNPRLVMLFSGGYGGPLGVVDSDVTSTGQVRLEVLRGHKRWRVRLEADRVSVALVAQADEVGL